MEWQKLDLSKAAVLKNEVNTALSKLNAFIGLGDESEDGYIDRNEMEGRRAAVISSVQRRIEELESFYIQHNDDERAILFEKERIRLRKAIQPFVASSQSSRDGSRISSKHNRSGKSSGAHSTVEDHTILHTRSIGSPKPAFNGISRSISGNASVGTSPVQQQLPPSPTKIYDWEASSKNGDRKANSVSPGGRADRTQISIDGETFSPEHSSPGFYMRDNASIPVNVMEKYVDFQVVLTVEEMVTLAARKRAAKRGDHKLDRSMAAAKSVHSSVPYVEPKLIANSVFRRPDNPQKWMDSKDMRPHKK